MRPRVLLAMSEATYRRLFDDELRERLQRLAVLADPRPVDTFTDPSTVEALRDTEVLLTSWGAPPVDAAALRAAPKLRAVLHAAGTIKDLITEDCWERGVLVSTAAEANAIPVAEYTLAAVLAAGKRLPAFVARYAASPGDYSWRYDLPEASNYRRTVGVVGFSRVGRRVVDLLRPFDLDVLVADPYADPDAVSAASARLVDLDELVAASHTVTLHAPQLSQTYQMIDAARLAAMPNDTTLINTARGSLVDTAALTAECESGRLSAILDVTDPEPLPAGSPLYRLPNVVLTPHVAGALHGEGRRLAALALDELALLAAGEPLQHQVHRSTLPTIA